MRLDNKTIQMASGPNYAALTTLFKDGVPQTHVMWVDTDGENILINTEIHRFKYKNVLKDPRVTVMIWKHDDPFKFVEIRQSIDGIYDQFEYLRYGAKFDKVCENAEKFSALPNSDFAVICTISNYNLLGIDAIDEFMQKRNWIVYYNVANTPDYLLLHNLPEEVKNYIKLP